LKTTKKNKKTCAKCPFMLTSCVEKYRTWDMAIC
jgi:hypothetical protein